MNDADVRVELQKLQRELRGACNDRQRAEIHKLIDKWLDERLVQKGAHPGDCSCWECDQHVAEVLARRLGECTDARDVATDGCW